MCDTMEQAIAFLKNCRIRQLQCGGISFEFLPWKKAENNVSENDVRAFFAEQGVAVGTPFLKFPARYVPTLKSHGINIDNAIDISDKFSR